MTNRIVASTLAFGLLAAPALAEPTGTAAPVSKAGATAAAPKKEQPGKVASTTHKAKRHRHKGQMAATQPKSTAPAPAGTTQ